MHAKKVTRYYSECGKGYWSKRSALDHEENCMCWGNPKNKTCKTCKYGDYIPWDGETGDGGYWGCDSPNYNEEHSGGPPKVDYISVKCEGYRSKPND